jgi:cellulose synthase/poly-beta-1,6-N-acetylglucosamine synthase-like glycosyltransferase
MWRINQPGRQSFLVGVFTAPCLNDTPAPPHRQGRPLPLFSVILCTYNRAHLVKRAIALVLTQSYSNWELIIIDDGSADDTWQVVMPVVKSDPRITIATT